MSYQGKPCVVEVWDAKQAVIKASFDLTPITTEFQQCLVNQLTKNGVPLAQQSPDSEVIVRGKYVRIDEGSQFLRYMLTFIAGKAIVQVEGELFVKGKGTARLSATAKRGWGLFGGNSQSLLKGCAKTCANTIARQVMSGLKQAS
jgi:hypothetical protein